MFMRSFSRLSTCVVLSSLLLSGCETDDDSGTTTPTTTDLELNGTWTTSFQGTEVITNTAWNGATVVEYSNNANIAYTQNPADDQYNPSKFNKLVWTQPSGNTFYYCWLDYGKDSLALAKASTLVADETDPDNSGCGGFGWTKMTKQ